MSLVRDKIKNLDFFNVLTKEQIDSLVDISTIKTYNKDYVLYYENTKIHYLYFLIDGLAKSYKIDKYDNEIFLYYIQDNSIITEISTINDDILTAYSNISFAERSQVLVIDYKLFKTYFLDTNILSKEFINEILKRSKHLEDLINREFIFDAVTKVSMMIGTNLSIFNKLKRHTVALVLHIQPSTLSRVLNKLKKDNIIDIICGKVSIVNMNDLKAIYEEYLDEKN
jgi:CRP/FNR family transcriptional regulator